MSSTRICPLASLPAEKYLTQPIWVAQLSNGEVVCQEDITSSSWLSLREYIRENNTKIENLWIQFRDNVQKPLPAQAEGYFFSKNFVGMLGTEGFHFYLIGHLDNGFVHCQRWKVPEMIWIENFVRRREEVEHSLICQNE